jgi:hypothetical protein
MPPSQGKHFLESSWSTGTMFILESLPCVRCSPLRLPYSMKQLLIQATTRRFGRNPFAMVIDCVAVYLLMVSTVSPAIGVDWLKKDKEYVEQIVPILKTACLDCHSGAESSGGLSINHFKTAKSILKERSTWEKIVQRMEIEDMPPADGPVLAVTERKKLIEWVKATINDVECGKTPNPGSVTMRRLNRTEYRNTIRDFLGVDYAPASGFPGDDVGYGFDNIGDVLTLPPLLMEKYISAAEEISRKAIIAPDAGPVFESTRKAAQLSADQGGSVSDGKFVLFSNGKITIEEQIPWKGTFSLDVAMSGSPAGNEYPRVLVAVDGKKAKEFTVQTEDMNSPKEYNVPLRIAKAGKRSISIAFTNDKMVEKDGKKEDRNLWVYDVRIVGQKPSDPLPAAQLPKSHREIVKASPGNGVTVQQAAAEVLKPLASKAFRRLATPSEVKRLAELVADVVESGQTYEAGLQSGLQAILCSPNFLFKVEEPESKVGANPYPLLSEFELATRMSYFLWSSMPDKELLQVAQKKQLRDPEILKQQIKRMLDHARSKAIVENFAGQWLTLRKLDQFSPNANMFPTWNEEIRELARRETYLFFASVMREDKSILRLLDADYTFLNDKLAKFYGIPGVTGPEFRMVSTKGHKRMGLLTHASILAVTSNPTRTSPVKRGKWVLDNILGTPPPPAPPGVPELDKAELTGTLRERIEQHRADPACASCHKLMDPIGLALENYDAVGRWRTLDYGAAIDPKGELPSGEVVNGPGELIKNLRDKNTDKFARCLTEKMMTYALGRGLEYYDRCAVDRIQAKLAPDDYRFTTLIFEIITSDPFQRKGVRDEP